MERFGLSPAAAAGARALRYSNTELDGRRRGVQKGAGQGHVRVEMRRRRCPPARRTRFTQTGWVVLGQIRQPKPYEL